MLPARVVSLWVAPRAGCGRGRPRRAGSGDTPGQPPLSTTHEANEHLHRVAESTGVHPVCRENLGEDGCSLSVRGATVEDHRRFAPQSAETTARRGDRVNRLHPDSEVEIAAGSEQLLQTRRSVHWEKPRGFSRTVFSGRLCRGRCPRYHVSVVNPTAARSRMPEGRGSQRRQGAPRSQSRLLLQAC